MNAERSQWAAACASLFLMMLAAGAVYIVIVGLKPIAADLDWPRSIPSAAYALTMFGMGVGGIAMGRWSDRVGVGRPAAVGVVAVAAGCFLASRVTSPMLFLAVTGIFIGALGNGALFVPLLADVTRRFHRRRGLAVAVVAAGPNLAGAVFPPLHRYLIDAWGWRGTYLGYSLAMLLFALPLAAVVGCSRREEPAAAQTIAATGPTALGMRPNVLQLLLCLAIVGCCVAMSMPVVQLVAHATDLGHPAARAAEALSLLLATSLVARVAWGALSDRIGGVAALCLGSGAQCVMLATFLIVESLPGLYLIAALYGLAYGGITPMYSLVIRQYMPLGQVGWRIGVVYLFGTVGMSLGGLCGGIVHDVSGSYDLAFLIGIAFNAANLAIVLPLLRRERRGTAGTLRLA